MGVTIIRGRSVEEEWTCQDNCDLEHTSTGHSGFRKTDYESVSPRIISIRFCFDVHDPQEELYFTMEQANAS